MLYHLELLVAMKNAKLTATDRNGNDLILTLSNQGDFTLISTWISMPNRIWIHFVGSDPLSYVELKSLQLGHIKFKNDCLEKLFVYHYDNRITRSLMWKYGGKAEFQFYEHDPILYHLRLNSTI